jgi:hypothetical protein
VAGSNLHIAFIQGALDGGWRWERVAPRLRAGNATSPPLARSTLLRFARLAPTSLSAARWGAVPKAYVQCLRDHAMPPSVQRWLCARRPDVAVRTLDTDHSPFFSARVERAPMIDAIAKGLGGA